MTSITSRSGARGRTGSREAGLKQRMARRAFLRVLRELDHGQFTIEEGDARHVFGQDDGLRAKIVVRDPSFWTAALLEGSVGAGRAYMEGAWTTDDLTAVVRVIARNAHVLERWNRGVARWLGPAHRAALWLGRNTVGGARRNIHEHYDLGNEFFAGFLDPTMMYSSAIYPRPEAGLDEAAQFKVHHICRKLELSPQDHVLEIGTGWGGFALTAARDYGCRVTTTTISDRQYEEASKRVHEAGLGDRVCLLKQDYRKLEGKFDKLVSIEMIEAVGADHLREYMHVCSERLRANGRMLLQAIVIEDQRYAAAARSIDFIKKYIFPGSFIPSPGAIAEAVARKTDLRLVHLEDITPHYARTLHDWHERFVAASDRIRAMGFDEAFLRRWRFYFSYCEGGFTERRIGVQQLVYAKPESRESVQLLGTRG